MAAANDADQHVSLRKIRHNLFVIKALILMSLIVMLACLFIYHHTFKPAQIAALASAIILTILGIFIVWRMFKELFTAIMRNETERRNLEVMLVKSQKMEAIGTLAGGITHDFNNILAAILGYTELALLQEPAESRVKRNLEQIQKACQRARELVSHILTFSRQSTQEPQPIQISTIIKEGYKMLRASIPASIQIVQQVESEHGLVNADPTQIHQVIMNLCINAAHAMRDSGGTMKVMLTERIIAPETENWLPELRPGSYLRLTVKDEGKGVAPEHLSRIFDPYFTTKEKDGGSGLGLAVVRGIVDRCGGAVTVKSEVGKGTTVHVYFPKVNQPFSATQILPENSMPTGDERILFIDDEKTLADIGKEMLESLGYQVTASTSSTEALKLFHTRPEGFDLVITDMTMPKINGKALAMEFMKIRKDIPIIMCTGFSEKITAENAKMIGIKAFAMKPFMMQDLAKTIRQVLTE